MTNVIITLFGCVCFYWLGFCRGKINKDDSFNIYDIGFCNWGILCSAYFIGIVIFYGLGK